MAIKVLLADKSITIQKVVEMLFSGRDYEIVCASDGDSALDEAARVLPDVVLVDLDLPGIDGYTLATRLKQTPQLARIPVILMMSRDDVFDGARATAAGILDHIAKPFESQDLIGKVKKALAAEPQRFAEPASPAKTVAVPASTPAPAKPKPSAPADIFDIISEAPTQEELVRASAPVEEESVYEVEPVVEEVDQPREEVQPEIAFASRERAPEDRQQASRLKSPMPSDEALRSMVEETVAKLAKEALDKAIPAPMPREELRRMAEETVSRMAQDVFKGMTPPVPKISPETVRRGIEEAVMTIAREIAQDVIEKVAWDVIPQLAEVLIKEEIERLKAAP
jgi:CheY-like chemotaxis protein